jgi:NADH dehydrogenase (ubiquinone) 1 alpha subcomplex subunit 13
LAAERDRELCKAARMTRDAEEEAMKNIEGWEVGTWFGHKVFKTIDNP